MHFNDYLETIELTKRKTRNLLLNQNKAITYARKNNVVKNIGWPEEQKRRKKYCTQIQLWIGIFERFNSI